MSGCRGRGLLQRTACPSELRSIVYGLVVIQEENIHMLCAAAALSERPPALAKVCRQLRSEVLPIYWSNNTFQVGLCCNKCYKRDQQQIEAIVGKFVAGAGCHVKKIAVAPWHTTMCRIETPMAPRKPLFHNLGGWRLRLGDMVAYKDEIGEAERAEKAGAYWLVKQ